MASLFITMSSISFDIISRVSFQRFFLLLHFRASLLLLLSGASSFWLMARGVDGGVVKVGFIKDYASTNPTGCSTKKYWFIFDSVWWIRNDDRLDSFVKGESHQHWFLILMPGASSIDCWLVMHFMETRSNGRIHRHSMNPLKDVNLIESTSMVFIICHAQA